MEEQGSPTGKSGDASAPERAALVAAMLEISGARGYRSATTEALLEHSGASELSPHFDSPQDCFAAAYSVEEAHVWEVLHRACSTQEGWPQRLHATLDSLFSHVTAHPGPARVLVVEVHVAGGTALRSHERFLQRLSLVLQAEALRDTAAQTDSPAPTTAEFMVGAVERSISSYLSSRDASQLRAAFPELMHLILSAYLGEENAEQLDGLS